LATFEADITPPVGHPLLAGWKPAAKSIKDPLSARGLVLVGATEPLVICALDWCELRNDAYDRWREALAAAAGTKRERVLLTCIHQHDAPYADLEAQRLLDEHGLKNSMFDPKFFEIAIARTAEALKDSLAKKRRVTHYGTGQAEVAGIASNRRVEIDGQPPRFNRYSFTSDKRVKEAPDGVIDPLVKTLSFWDGDAPIAAISAYATHPMSYYGGGEVSGDFPAMARERRQRAEPGVFQVYVSGASGDVTAAKYNDGTFDGRVALTERLTAAMDEAWRKTERHPLAEIGFRVVPLTLKPETAGNYAIDEMRKTLADEKATQLARSTAALGLSWQKRCAAGQAIDLPVIDFGKAQYLVLPAESFVAYQLAAQKLRPDSLVLTAGYGECAPGYIPTAATRAEGFVAEHGYCWVAAGEEESILTALSAALRQE
jgi:hypothetical protein